MDFDTDNTSSLTASPENAVHLFTKVHS